MEGVRRIDAVRTAARATGSGRPFTPRVGVCSIAFKEWSAASADSVELWGQPPHLPLFHGSSGLRVGTPKIVVVS